MTQLKSLSTLPTPNSSRSFWHSQPSEKLLGHRTAADLPKVADVVVVGSGISGAFAARELMAKGEGLNILMLEAREACWGATGRNGGHCQPITYSRPPHLGHWEFRNYNYIKNLIAENKIQCDWQSLTGCHAFYDKEIWEEEKSAVEKLKSLDPELGATLTIVTSTSTPSLAEVRAPNAVGAIISSEAASLWPYKLIAWVLEDLLSRNSPSFNLQTNTPVTQIQYQSDSTWAVHTPRGIITTKKVLLATNGYTSHLISSFGDLIVPVKGEMSSLIAPPSARPSETTRNLDTYTYGFIGHAIQNSNQDDYLVQRPFTATGEGGELMFGGGRAYAVNAGIGISDDSTIDPPAASYLRHQLNYLLDLNPQNKSLDDTELQATYEWSGIMGYSRDFAPWVGELPAYLTGGRGLYVCAGYTGHGMPNAGLSGKAVADIMLGIRERGEVVDLPPEFEISVERIAKAKTLVDVKIADEMVKKF